MLYLLFLSAEIHLPTVLALKCSRFLQGRTSARAALFSGKSIQGETCRAELVQGFSGNSCSECEHLLH